VRSREVTELPDGVTKVLRFGGVTVADGKGGPQVFMQGPVDLNRYHTFLMQFTQTSTGEQQQRPGLSLRVVLEDGKVVDKPLNVISNRLIENLTPDLESGDYLTTEYSITASGAPPKTTYEVLRTPIAHV
jgi:hypothetical protein